MRFLPVRVNTWPPPSPSSTSERSMTNTPRRILAVKPNPYLPNAINGANRSLDALLKGLVRRSHSATLLCQADLEPPLVDYNWSVPQVPYGIFRVPDPGAVLGLYLDRLRPDVVLIYGSQVTAALIAICATRGVPVVHYICGASFELVRNTFVATVGVSHVANSRFTADLFERWFGLATVVIPSLVEPLTRRKVAAEPKSVLFVNPTPQKGVHVALEIARRCPEQHFIFAGSWNLGPEWRRHVESLSPSNVEFTEPFGDVEALYARARVLLVPSVWEESRPRVVIEAQSLAIPTVASNRGGIAEAVGPGGIVLDIAAPIDDWVNALVLLRDDRIWATLSSIALEHSRRSEIGPDTLLDDWERHLDAIGANADPSLTGPAVDRSGPPHRTTSI